MPGTLPEPWELFDMRLEDAQNWLRIHQGRAKAFALRFHTFLRLFTEQNPEAEVDYGQTFKLLGVPVVIVGEGQPEGVIV